MRFVTPKSRLWRCCGPMQGVRWLRILVAPSFALKFPTCQSRPPRTLWSWMRSSLAARTPGLDFPRRTSVRLSRSTTPSSAMLLPKHGSGTRGSGWTFPGDERPLPLAKKVIWLASAELKRLPSEIPTWSPREATAFTIWWLM